jgi:hypothetical protein
MVPGFLKLFPTLVGNAELGCSKLKICNSLPKPNPSLCRTGLTGYPPEIKVEDVSARR